MTPNPTEVASPPQTFSKDQHRCRCFPWAHFEVAGDPAGLHFGRMLWGHCYSFLAAGGITWCTSWPKLLQVPSSIQGQAGCDSKGQGGPRSPPGPAAAGQNATRDGDIWVPLLCCCSPPVPGKLQHHFLASVSASLNHLLPAQPAWQAAFRGCFLLFTAPRSHDNDRGWQLQHIHPSPRGWASPRQGHTGGVLQEAGIWGCAGGCSPQTIPMTGCQGEAVSLRPCRAPSPMGRWWGVGGPSHHLLGAGNHSQAVQPSKHNAITLRTLHSFTQHLPEPPAHKKRAQQDETFSWLDVHLYH